MSLLSGAAQVVFDPLDRNQHVILEAVWGQVCLGKG